MPLEEGRLRLQGRRPRPGRLEHSQAEVTQPGGVVGQAPRAQQGRVRVDPHAQGAPLGHRIGEAAPEGSAQGLADGARTDADDAHRAARAASCSCRDVTENGPFPTTSIAWTAAPNCCTVVMIGLSAAVVAVRISYPSTRAP